MAYCMASQRQLAECTQQPSISYQEQQTVVIQWQQNAHTLHQQEQLETFQEDYGLLQDQHPQPHDSAPVSSSTAIATGAAPVSMLQQLYHDVSVYEGHCGARDIAEAMWACGKLKHFNAAFFSAVSTTS
eukprot:jgi/Chrzof1/14289/Cz08g31410.t1